MHFIIFVTSFMTVEYSRQVGGGLAKRGIGRDEIVLSLNLRDSIDNAQINHWPLKCACSSEHVRPHGGFDPRRCYDVHERLG